MSSVSDRALTAVKWSYLGVVARVASQLIANIFLARILGPEAFGVFAITLLMVGPIKLFSEMGMGSALIQKQTISQEDVDTVFTWLQVAGIVVAVIVFAAADYVAWFFNNPAAAQSIRYVSMVFLFYPATLIASSLLQRSLNLKAIQIASVTAYVLGFIVIGVFCAISGLGVLSLILAFVSQAVLECVLLLAQAKPRLRFLFRRIDGHLIHFAKRVVPTNLTNWVLDSADNFLIGKIFGAKSLGMYAVVFNFVRTPTGHLVTTLQNILFSTSSRLQHDNERLTRSYIATVSAVALVAIPIFAGIAAISETCIAAVYGPEWFSASPLLLPLALAMPLHCLTAVTGPILWGKGRVGQEFRVSLATGVIMVLSIILLAKISLVAAVWGVFAVYALRAIWMVATISKICAIPVRTIVNVLAPGAMLGSLVSGSLFLVNLQLLEHNLTALSRFGFSFVLATLISLTWLVFFGQRVLPDDLKLIVTRLIANWPFLQKCWTKCVA